MKAVRPLPVLVEEQLVKWHDRLREQKKQQEVETRPAPTITVGRETGSGASEVVRKLAEQTGMDLFGTQIIQKVAESAKMSTQIIESLDEKEITKRNEWLTAMFERQHLWPDEYLKHLTKVIGTVGRYGNAIIVGRGARFILPAAETFRIRFVAPIDFRIRYTMQKHQLSRDDAERYIVHRDSERRAFVRKYFHADVADPTLYDLLINMESFSVDGAVALVRSAFALWKKEKGYRPAT
jgi:cytidylate kinase